MTRFRIGYIYTGKYDKWIISKPHYYVIINDLHTYSVQAYKSIKATFDEHPYLPYVHTISHTECRFVVQRYN